MNWQHSDIASVVSVLESGSRPKGGATVESGEIPSLGGENILKHGGVTLEEVKRVPRKFFERMTKGHLKNADVLINKDGAQTGKVGFYKNNNGANACINEHLFLIRGDAEKITQSYLYYSLLSQPCQNQIEAQISGSAQPGLKSDFLKGVFTRIPESLPEQSKIAEVLSKVDQAIEQTESLIAKQQRIKTGLMQDLLTRGIDEHGNLRSEETHEFKDSPLGRIPVEWNKGKGIDLFTLHAGFAVQRLFDSDQGEWLYLKVDDFNNPANSNGLMTASTTFDCSAQLSNRLLAPKTIVFPKRGAAIFLNRVELLKRTATVDPNLMGLRTREGVLPEYMRFILLHRNLSNICDNSGIPQINNKHLYPLIFILPDEFEQRRIVQCLEKCEAAIHIVAGNLHKLRSLKTALMQDLLTGNKRVTPLLETMKVGS